MGFPAGGDAGDHAAAPGAAQGAAHGAEKPEQMHREAELENGTAAQQQAADEAAASAAGVDEQRYASPDIDTTALDPTKTVCSCSPPTPPPLLCSPSAIECLSNHEYLHVCSLSGAQC